MERRDKPGVRRTGRRALAALALALAAAPALADWRVLDGAEIAAVLTTHDVIFDGVAWERHLANGRVLVRGLEGPAGRTSIGTWTVQGDARCLRWTRAQPWECYSVEGDGAAGIRYTDTWRNVSTGRLAPRGGP
jgi:hypothetical protein